MASARDEALAALRQRTTELLRNSAGGDRVLAHTERVYGLARRLARQEEADRFAVGAAALLHEWPGDAPPAEAALRAAWPAIPDPAFAAVGDTLAALAAPAAAPDSTLEARVACDAHHLDELGAIGIANLLLAGGARHEPLYEHTDPFALMRSLAPDQYLIERLYALLAALPRQLHTPTARAIASRRSAIMLFYLEALRDELAETLPDALLPEEHWLVPQEDSPR
jgi:uncharacterized protein